MKPTRRTARSQRTPALDAWRAELRAGKRTPSTFDALWRAACWDQSSIEADRLGLHEAAKRDRRTARDILLRAAQQQRGAA